MTDIGIGNICNSNCWMCTAILPVKEGYVEPSLEQIKSMIDREPYSDNYVLTGGEPTLRKDIIQICTYINNKYPESKIILITNGRRFCYEKYARLFLRIKNFEIITEIHGADPKIHDYITRSKGSYGQTYQGIKNMLSLGYPVELRFVISKLNYRYLKQLSILIIEKFAEIKRVVIFPIDVVGNAYINREVVAIKYSEFIQHLYECIDILSYNKMSVELYHIPYCILNPGYHKYIKRGITVTERRINYALDCVGCKFENECPRVWKTYLSLWGNCEFNKII